MAITWHIKSATSRQAKQKEIEPEDLGIIEFWFTKKTGIVIQKGGTCSAKLKREKGKGRDITICIISYHVVS